MALLKKITFLVFFTFLSTSLWAQTIIQGTVKDASTGKPVPDVNVYLSQTTYGAATNNRGAYKFTVYETGKFKLAFSFVGYESKNFDIQLNPNGSKTVNVSLKKQQLSLKQTTVSGSNKAWEKHYRRFRKEFIGKTNFADNTKIQNPYVLRFDERHGKLTAKAKNPIIIINKALGYKIHLELVKFRWSSKGGVSYGIFSHFTRLKPRNQEQQKKWQDSRRDTYYKSLRYFFKSLYLDHIKKNDFIIQNHAFFQPLSKSETKFRLEGNPNVTSKNKNMLKGYKLARKAQINYKHSKSIPKKLAIQAGYISVIKATKRNHIFFIDDNGHLLNPFSVQTGGYWGRMRIANTLPLFYQVHKH